MLLRKFCHCPKATAGLMEGKKFFLPELAETFFYGLAS